jgi:leucyl-tRNA---protein transferase
VSERLLPSTPPEFLVRDEEDDCVYLPGRRARQPLRQPLRRLTAVEFDGRLAAGDRRAGSLIYNQACPSCAACQAIRVDVRAFAPSRSQRRAQVKGDAAVTVELGPIVVDDRRVHGGRPPIGTLEYESFFAHSCVEGFEVRYLVAGQLCGVAITDRGARSLSAVYTFWDPAFAALSLGTYSILSQIALARDWELDWLYLGLAIRENRSMAYKLAFMPHERRVDGAWQRFSRG